MIPKPAYGWVPDIPDRRDFLYSAIRPVIRRPKKVDLRQGCSEIEYQGKLGSCTAQALAGNLEFLDKKIDSEYVDVSRLFIYYNERLIEGTIGEDAGAAIRDGIKALATYGVCSAKKWPYDITKFKKKPLKVCYTEGLKNKISSYYRLNTLDDMLKCLSSGYPFVFGFSVYESFETDYVAKTGIVSLPKINEKFLGGHAVCAVGYDKKTKMFIVRNSWGSGWGDKGYFYMPFEYLSNRNLSDDFWYIIK